LILGLQDRWTNDVAGLPGVGEAKAAAFANIVAAHGQPLRRYHGLGHLQALFALLDQHAQSVAERLPLHFAVWWHDAVYDPQASDNEGRSAALAKAELKALGAADDLITQVVQLILATSHHWDSPAMGDGDYFLDADIAILGASPSAYDRYADDVRAEYAFAPDAAFRAGRARFLSNAMARPRLFRTPAFEAAYTDAARDNMRRELGRLGAA
jgi:predicted metal-dependent HD superfamily phosphohydrolase